MDALHQELLALANRPVGLVVYLGADASVVELAAQRPATRWVLVQGDPDELTELRHVAGTKVDVIGLAIAPDAGVMRWHRYNLATLNGPQDASGLVRYYPRLRQVGMISVEAEGIASLVDRVIPDAAATEAVLVIDLPGQEAALLERLDEDRLGRFSAIVMRGCSDRVGEGSSRFDETVAALTASFWRVEPRVEQDPLWPVAMLTHDRAGRIQREQAQRVADLESSLADLNRRAEQGDGEARTLRGALAVANEQLLRTQEELAAMRHRSEALETDMQRHQVAHDTERARLAQEAQAKESALSAAAQRIAELEGAVSERDARLLRLGEELRSAVQSLTGSLEASVAKGAEDAMRAKALGEQAAQSGARVAELERAARVQADEVSELRRQLAAAARLSADLEAARARCGTLEADAAVAAQHLTDTTRKLQQVQADGAKLAADRDAQAKAVAEVSAQLKEEQAYAKESDDRAAELNRKLQQAQAEVAKLAADREAQAKVVAEVSAKLKEEQAHAKASDDRAAELARKLQQAQADLAKLTAEREAQTKAAAEAAVQLKDRQKRIVQLEAEVADATQRLDLMHQELAKAEGQFDLLREMLVQEPTL